MYHLRDIAGRSPEFTYIPSHSQNYVTDHRWLRSDPASANCCLQSGPGMIVVLRTRTHRIGALLDMSHDSKLSVGIGAALELKEPPRNSVSDCGCRFVAGKNNSERSPIRTEVVVEGLILILFLSFSVWCLAETSLSRVIIP